MDGTPPDFAKLKGKLARYELRLALNISQVRSVRAMRYVGDPYDSDNRQYSVIDTVFDKSFCTDEPYETLMARITATRMNDGPNGLIEITRANPNDNSTQ